MLTYPDIYSALVTLRVTIDIVQGSDCQYVDIVSPLHKRKRTRLSWCYGVDYTRADILADKTLQADLKQRFNLQEIHGWARGGWVGV